MSKYLNAGMNKKATSYRMEIFNHNEYIACVEWNY